MKKNLVKIAAAGLFVAAIISAPVLSRAQETPANPPAAAPAAPAKPIPFRGKLTAVDTNAMTLTVGKRTFAVTSETKINKDGKPATLSEGVVGDNVGGAYKKADDGKLNATTVNLGVKAEAEKPMQ